ncbi:MAG: toll/interleukin-1 receptor domain-containing protein [Devosia sp.]|nr:toll/interleukin-1 receptor domain-containing protein [Devosia sp.]
MVAGSGHDRSSSHSPTAILWQRLSTAWERLFRYDFFISYAWVDGRDYAVALVDQLRARPYRPRCFIDHTEIGGGGHLDATIRSALRRSRAMVLVGTAAALKSPEVQTEVTTFSATGNRRILAIDAGGAVRELDNVHPLHAALNRRLSVDEQVGADGKLSPEISNKVLVELDAMAGFLTSGRLQQFVLAAIVGVALTLSATAAVFYGSASATATLNRASTLAGAANNELNRGTRSNYLPLVRAASNVAMTRETRDAMLTAVLTWPRLEAIQQLTFNWPIYMVLSEETGQFVGADSTKIHALAYPSLKRLHRPIMLDQVTIETVTPGRDGGTLYLGYDTGAIASFDLRSGSATNLYHGTGEVRAVATIADGWLFFIRKNNQQTEGCLLRLSDEEATGCQSLDGFNPTAPWSSIVARDSSSWAKTRA